MLRLTIAAALLLGLVGCKETNNGYCDNGENSSTPTCRAIDDAGGSDSNTKCTGDGGCSGSTPLCDTGKGVCVACMTGKTTECSDDTPVCDTSAEMCVGCTSDMDCASGTGVCLLPSGACAQADNVIHAASTGTDGAPNCGSPPQKPCSLQDALMIVTMDSTKNVITLDDSNVYAPSNSNFMIAADVTIDTKGATFHKKNDGPIFEINSGKSLTLLSGGTIEMATGTQGHGIQCDSNASLTAYSTTIRMNDRSAITTSNGCKITLAKVSLTGNGAVAIAENGDSVTIYQSVVFNNSGGGVNVGNGTFNIVGNVFLNNGGPTSNTGGILINTSAEQYLLEFNSLSGNNAQAGIAPGIQCSNQSRIVQNNIIWSNATPATPQVGGNCMHAYSDIGPASVPTAPVDLDGGNNISMDPMFINAMSNLDVQSASPVKRKANSTETLPELAKLDINGTPRTAPADIGAYVVPAN